MARLTWKILIFFLFFLSGQALAEQEGVICLGKNLAVPASEHSQRLFLTIDDSDKIYFIRPYVAPRVVAKGLDLKEDHSVKVYFGEKLVQSWVVNFSKSKSAAFNVWRAPGAWRTDPIDPSVCQNNLGQSKS